MIGWLALRKSSVPNAARKSALSVGQNDYVNASACAGCHRKIWETYRQTGMYRSFISVTADRAPEELRTNPAFFHQASDRHYQILPAGGTFMQRRHQIGFDGKETNVLTKDIHFAVGSGNHARTYLHRTADGRIFELPLAWYAEEGGLFAMNPGYDHPNHRDFSRQITPECIFCHTGYPEVKPGADRFGAELRIGGRIPEGIDCQRCHGPGQAHIEAASSGAQDDIRRSIVNPARLSKERQLELCMQCHLETTSAPLPHSILRFDRAAFSYRPGEPLSDYSLHFDNAPGRGWDDKFEIAHQAYRLRKSACFQKSQGELTCTTCHDPHQAPRGAEATEHYRNKCLSCHAPTLTKKIAARTHSADPACANCHMPKRRTDDVVHVVMTDHYIQRKSAGKLLTAPRAERRDSEDAVYRGPVIPYYPAETGSVRQAELYRAVAQVKQGSNLQEGIALLSAAIRRHQPEEAGFYFELAEAYARQARPADAVPYYQEALRRSPGLRPALIGLARNLSAQGDFGPAVDTLRKALEAAPADTALWNDLGLTQLQQGQKDDAMASFRKSIEIDPNNAEAHTNLAGTLSSSDPAGAEASYRRAILLRPDFFGAHRGLANLLASRGQLPEAQYHFSKSTHYNPKYFEGYYDYGMALAAAERYGEAARQFETAGKVNPSSGAAEVALGDMLALQDRIAQAVPHYQRALDLDSRNGAAHLGLGRALAAQRRLPEARAHLSKAAETGDPAVRAEAQDILRSLL